MELKKGAERLTMTTQYQDDKYFLEKEQIIEDLEDDYIYEEVPVEDEFLHSDEEDLDDAVRIIQEGLGDESAAKRKEILSPKPTLTHKPEVVDDFVRNFLMRMGMMKTLDCFQTEWYELDQKGLLKEDQVGQVPDAYVQNQTLTDQVQYLENEKNKFKSAAQTAREACVKIRKDRDYHRMHHKRVVQEKNKLITDIKRLTNHYSAYEPTLRQLKQKYEAAMKEKMLITLERDRALGQLNNLNTTMQSLVKKNSVASGLRVSSRRECNRGGLEMVDDMDRGPTQRTLADQRYLHDQLDNDHDQAHPQDSTFPPDSGVNPALAAVKGPPTHLSRSGGYRLSKSFLAHELPVSSVVLHPKKDILCTTSDDQTWKLWAVPAGELIMTGEGHTDWVSSSQFHPSGTRLATTSGDTTVKIWDFSEAQCIHTFMDHTQAVWSCSWHSCGDFLATASMDNSSKIWDINSLRCRQTLRGHADSVNSVEFLAGSNTLCTSSADKTVSLWDVRTGLCAQTFFGHMHSVNHATFNLKGDTIASCDAYGNIKLWDVRGGAQYAELDVGPHPANHVVFDASGALLAISSNDATVKMYEIVSKQTLPLLGHDDAVHATVFHKSGDYLLSGGSDACVKVWS